MRNQLCLTAHVLTTQHTADAANGRAVPYRNPPVETMPSPEKAPLPLPRPDQHRHAGAPLPTSQRLSRCLVARAAATRPASLPSCPQITLSAKGMPGRSVFGIWRATRRSLCCSHCLIFRENLLLITASPDDPADAATPDKSSLSAPIPSVLGRHPPLSSTSHRTSRIQRPTRLHPVHP